NTLSRTDYITATEPTASLVVSPNNLAFGAVAVSQCSNLNFSVINTGQQSLTGTGSTTSPFSIVSGTPYDIASGQTGTVTVSFCPVSTGSFAAGVVFVSNGGNSSNTVSGTGAVAPVADFSGSPTTGLAPLMVTFTNKSSGTITNAVWNFGNGSSN